VQPCLDMCRSLLADRGVGVGALAAHGIGEESGREGALGGTLPQMDTGREKKKCGAHHSNPNKYPLEGIVFWVG